MVVSSSIIPNKELGGRGYCFSRKDICFRESLELSPFLLVVVSS
jgi:hypothetical protein